MPLDRIGTTMIESFMQAPIIVAFRMSEEDLGTGLHSVRVKGTIEVDRIETMSTLTTMPYCLTTTDGF